MSEVAAWVALVATCIAALLTAANLGARPTGWGFVIFATGAAAWVVVGLTTGQRQLLYSNVFLGLIDIFGIWRWLGHRAHVDDSAAAEVDRSEDEERERRFSVGKLVGLPVRTVDGATIATVVDALVACDGGRMRYLVISRGGVAGVGETLHRLPWQSIDVDRDDIRTTLSSEQVSRLPTAASARR